MKLRFYLRIITPEPFRKLTFKTSIKLIIGNIKKMNRVYIWNDSLLIWNMIIIYGMEFLPKKTFFNYNSNDWQYLVWYHMELIERQEIVVLMIFWHFDILRSIFSCNFGPFLMDSNFFYPSKFILNKLLIIYNGSRVDRYVTAFCVILIQQMACIWNLLENGMFFFSKNVGIFTFCSKMGKTGLSILCGPRGVDRTPRSRGFDDFLTF